MQGNRGDFTETLINHTNDFYRRKGVALITKIPTPTKVLKSQGGLITKAFYEEKGVLDYLGVVQGLPVTFDAKETKAKSLPLSNIAPHQYEYMEDFIKQDGYAFILVHFSELESFYLLPAEFVLEYRTRAKDGGRKSIPIGEIPEKYRLEFKSHVDYLRGLNVYYHERHPK